MPYQGSFSSRTSSRHRDLAMETLKVVGLVVRNCTCTSKFWVPQRCSEYISN